MTAPVFISKIKPDPDELDFDALKRAGIALVQDLCGTIWTDYNAHDPGVTMLEQLCYGLTELAYRSDFSPEDYLAGVDGRIDLERHALYPPNEIFPSEAVTEDDFRKLLYDQIPEIEDVWIEDAASSSGNPSRDGLITVFVKLGDSNGTAGSNVGRTSLEARVRQQVANLFAQHRSICQDIDEIRIVGTRAFFLTGDIEIHSMRDPAAIYADIFFQCAHQVISGFQVERYEDVIAQGASLEQLFTGPVTGHGFIAGADGTGGADVRGAISVVQLIGLIRGIDGVRQVHRLGICDAEGNPADMNALNGNLLPRLQFPETEEQKGFLSLHFTHTAQAQRGADDSGAELQAEKASVLVDDARIELKKLQFESNAGRHRTQSLEQVFVMPRGIHRHLAQYHSIQHDFPAIYGINQYGVPATAAPHELARVKQLKAYLFVFEQLMANYLKSVQEIPRLFSVDADLTQSYFSQRITDRMLPNIEPLYVTDAGRIEKALDDIRAGFDPFEDRRSRVLDTLLAMYGEEFTQQTLRKFNYYHHRHSHGWLLENKLAFLVQIASLNRLRAAAFHTAEPAWDTDNVSGAQRKINVLLGLHEQHGCRSLCDVLLKRGLKLVPDANANNATLGRLHSRLTSGAAAARQPELHTIPESLFRKGFGADSYTIERHGDDAEIYFQASPRQQKLSLGKHVQYDDAARHVQEFREAIRRLNMASEGFHMVEHVLLRPRRHDSAEHAEAKPPHDFYAFRVSVIFPSWTARFGDREFRKLAQETVCHNLPAHVYPEFHWLDFVPMQDFEGRFRHWLEVLRKPMNGEQSVRALDHASARLVRFLQRHRQSAIKTHWV